MYPVEPDPLKSDSAEIRDADTLFAGAHSGPERRSSYRVSGTYIPVTSRTSFSPPRHLARQTLRTRARRRRRRRCARYWKKEKRFTHNTRPNTRISGFVVQSTDSNFAKRDSSTVFSSANHSRVYRFRFVFVSCSFRFVTDFPSLCHITSVRRRQIKRRSARSLVPVNNNLLPPVLQTESSRPKPLSNLNSLAAEPPAPKGGNHISCTGVSTAGSDVGFVPNFGRSFGSPLK